MTTYLILGFLICCASFIIKENIRHYLNSILVRAGGLRFCRRDFLIAGFPIAGFPIAGFPIAGFPNLIALISAIEIASTQTKPAYAG